MERKLATILFADLVGSTELGASLDPEYARDLLDRFYDAMEAEIALGGGTVEKFIGDAVVAVFGAPAAQEDHAERALQVALWMQERLQELFRGRLSLRIGVNSGEVAVGRPREGSSFATGDAVNVAARLEQAAEPGHVLVGERTASLVGGAFELGEPRTVEAKGKEGGVACRELRRMRAPRRPRGGHGLEARFVGRRRELEWLEDMLARTQAEGRPRLATVVGEAGMGKTSLVREFRERLPAGTRVSARSLPLLRPQRDLQRARRRAATGTRPAPGGLGRRHVGAARRPRDPRPHARSRRRRRSRAAGGASAAAGPSGCV